MPTKELQNVERALSRFLTHARRPTSFSRCWTEIHECLKNTDYDGAIESLQNLINTADPAEKEPRARKTNVEFLRDHLANFQHATERTSQVRT